MIRSFIAFLIAWLFNAIRFFPLAAPAAQTGRTVERFIRVGVSDSANTMREFPVDSIGEVGLAYDPKDVTAFQDAVKNMLSGQPSAPIVLSGPFDNTAAAAVASSGAAPALSGSYTVLAPIAGDNLPHTLYIAFGMRQYYTTGEPVFGLQRASATNSGYTLTKFTVGGGKYTAEFDVMGGIAPAWGAALLTAGS